MYDAAGVDGLVVVFVVYDVAVCHFHMDDHPSAIRFVGLCLAKLEILERAHDVLIYLGMCEFLRGRVLIRALKTTEAIFAFELALVSFELADNSEGIIDTLV